MHGSIHVLILRVGTNTWGVTDVHGNKMLFRDKPPVVRYSVATDGTVYAEAHGTGCTGEPERCILYTVKFEVSVRNLSDKEDNSERQSRSS